MGGKRAWAWCLTAVAISACAVDDDEPLARAAARVPVAALSAAPGETTEPEPETPASAPAPRTHEAVAADLAGSGEPFIAVAGVRGEDGSPSLPLYAQRNGGWRRIAEGEWPAGDGSVASAVDAADLDGDGRPELIALGTVEDGADGRRLILAVFRLRDRDLELVAEATWSGPAHGLSLAIDDRDGRDEVVVARRDRAIRAFTLDGGDLVASEARGLPRRGGDTVTMALRDAGKPMRLVVRAPGGGASMLGTVQDWNAELARLRNR